MLCTFKSGLTHNFSFNVVFCTVEQTSTTAQKCVTVIKNFRLMLARKDLFLKLFQICWEKIRVNTDDHCCSFMLQDSGSKCCIRLWCLDLSSYWKVIICFVSDLFVSPSNVNFYFSRGFITQMCVCCAFVQWHVEYYKHRNEHHLTSITCPHTSYATSCSYKCPGSRLPAAMQNKHHKASTQGNISSFKILVQHCGT